MKIERLNADNGKISRQVEKLISIFHGSDPLSSCNLHSGYEFNMDLLKRLAVSEKKKQQMPCSFESGNRNNQ